MICLPQNWKISDNINKFCAIAFIPKLCHVVSVMHYVTQAWRHAVVACDWSILTAWLYNRVVWASSLLYVGCWLLQEFNMLNCYNTVVQPWIRASTLYNRLVQRGCTTLLYQPVAKCRRYLSTSPFFNFSITLSTTCFWSMFSELCFSFFQVVGIDCILFDSCSVTVCVQNVLHCISSTVVHTTFKYFTSILYLRSFSHSFLAQLFSSLSLWLHSPSAVPAAQPERCDHGTLPSQVAGCFPLQMFDWKFRLLGEGQSQRAMAWKVAELGTSSMVSHCTSTMYNRTTHSNNVKRYVHLSYVRCCNLHSGDRFNDTQTEAPWTEAPSPTTDDWNHCSSCVVCGGSVCCRCLMRWSISVLYQC